MAKGIVLIVDDDVDTRMILSARLQKQDYTCVFAADCYQAISSARQHHPRAILLDLHLPAGDGYLYGAPTAEVHAGPLLHSGCRHQQ